MDLFVERHMDQGMVTGADVEDFAREHELAPEALTDLYDRLEERGIECEDCGREEAAPTRFSIDTHALQTTDALQLFLNEAGRHRLLTPQEEIELAKRTERGELQAKDAPPNASSAATSRPRTASSTPPCASWSRSRASTARPAS